MLVSRFAAAILLLTSLTPGSLAFPCDQAEESPLPRRAWLGVALEPSDEGVRVRDVFPDSSAAAAGMLAGDLLRSINGELVSDIPSTLAQLRPLRAGQVLQAELTRGDDALAVSTTLKEWPRETETDAYTVEYADVPSSSGRLRTIAYVLAAKPIRPASRLAHHSGPRHGHAR